MMHRKLFNINPFQKLLGLRLAMLALLTTALIACGNEQRNDSTPTGHYENATPQESSFFKNSISMPTEYADADKVILSLAAISQYGMEILFKEILDAGANEILLLMPRGSSLDINQSRFSELRRVLGNDISKVKLVPHRLSGQITVWARDWAPLIGMTDSNTQNGDPRILVDLNYYPRRPTNDNSPQALLQELDDFSRVSVPVYNEGGNFMINDSGHCLMTTRVTDANDRKYVSSDLILNGDQIAQYYMDFAGCSSVNIFPRMPIEATGHIDMWGKFLSDDLVIVGNLLDKAINLISSSSSKSKALTLQSYLNQRAADLTAMGYTVKRIPMPVPEYGRSTFRTYTNSLFVNGTALIPQYIRGGGGFGGFQYTDSQFMQEYEAQVRQVYESAGYRVKFIPSDNIIAHGGAIHCITMQVPAI